MAQSQQITAAYVQFYGWYKQVGGNLKKQLTTKNIQENEAISNCKIE